MLCFAMPMFHALYPAGQWSDIIQTLNESQVAL